MAITTTTLRLNQELRDQLALITDQQTRDLTKAWVQAWDEVSSDLNAALLDIASVGSHDGVISRMQLMRSSQLWQSLQIIAEHLGQLADESGVRITDDLAAVVREAGQAQAALLASQLPDGASINLDGWDRVDPRAIEAIVFRSTQRITSLTKPLAPQAYAAVKAELMRGIAAGTNPRQTAARMLQRAEGRFNGGLSRALVISRTEMLDAHRQAAAVAQQANADVLAGWVWTATLDPRTCPACWSQAGREHPLSEPGPLGHQQCRCARTPVTKPWADLGFDVYEPLPITPDPQTVFDGLSPAEQRQILGAKGFEAWKAGDFPMSDWSTRRDNPGWRPAYYTTRPPNAGLPAKVTGFPAEPFNWQPTTIKSSGTKFGDAAVAKIRQAFKSGNATVLVESPLSKDQTNSLLGDVEYALRNTGQTEPVTFHVRTGDPKFRGKGGSITLAYVRKGQNTVFINPKLAAGYAPTPAQLEALMSAASDVGIRRYILTHELGHIFDFARDHTFHTDYGHGERSFAFETTSEVARSLATKWREDLSRYGRTNPQEAYAEVYAQWLLGVGSDMTKEYARTFQWTR